jgi:uncharacterized protein (DUF779 family)
MELNLLGTYRNGNYNVSIYEDGTKIRFAKELSENDNFEAEFPESFDFKITGFCDAGCPMCFPKNTIIKTLDGNKRIQDIKENDIVVSYNLEENKKEFKNVINVFKNFYKGKLIVFHFNNTILKCTPNHKIFTNNGWKEAKDVNLNDELFSF